MRIRGIKSIGEHNKTADQCILELLRQGSKTFGQIQTHLKNEGFKYTRKGIALRLDHLRDLHFVNRRPFQQGHYSYFLSKKAEKDIGFQAKVFSSSVEGLLRAYFPPYGKKNSFTEDYFVRQLIERVGIFALFSIFQSLKIASKRPDSEKNAVMAEWFNNSISLRSIHNYFMDKKDSFLEFRSDEEAFESYFVSAKKQLEIQRLESIFKKMYPKEYEFCEETIRFQSYSVKSQLANDEVDKVIEQHMKRIHRKHKEHKNTQPRECPECYRERMENPPVVDVLGIRRKFFGKDWMLEK